MENKQWTEQWNPTQKDTANIGVTPNSGGTIPRYNL